MRVHHPCAAHSPFFPGLLLNEVTMTGFWWHVQEKRQGGQRWGKRAGDAAPCAQIQLGYALVVVILILLLVSYLAADLAMQVRSELRAAHNVKVRLAGRFLALAGIETAVFRKVDKPIDALGTPYEHFVEGYPYEEYRPGRGRFRYYLVNESGKIDLNTFPRGLMELFLAYHGLDEEGIEVVIDSILDWRDPDDLHRLNGAETDYYQALDDPYIPRNGRFQDPAEFFLVRGTAALRNKFDPYEVFTVNNGRSRINFNSLTPQMLAFLTGGDAEKIALYRQMQEEKAGVRLTVADMQTILGPERYETLRPFLVPALKNAFFAVTAVGEAGYEPGDETGVEEAPGVGGDGGEEERERRHWPGVRIQVLYNWRGGAPRFLRWRESFS